jgi:hypothetical protein
LDLHKPNVQYPDSLAVLLLLLPPWQQHWASLAPSLPLLLLLCQSQRAPLGPSSGLLSVTSTTGQDGKAQMGTAQHGTA